MDHLPPDLLAHLRAALAALPDGPAHRALADGSYGLCRTCGDPIDAPALLAQPTLAVCAACAAERHRSRREQRFGVCGVKPR